MSGGQSRATVGIVLLALGLSVVTAIAAVVTISRRASVDAPAESEPIQALSYPPGDPIPSEAGVFRTRAAVLAIDPTARAKVRPLDPTGDDVPHPIGAEQDVYTAPARRLRHLNLAWDSTMYRT